MQKEQSVYSSSSSKNKTNDNEKDNLHKNHMFSFIDESNKNLNKDFHKEKLSNPINNLENLNLKKKELLNQVNPIAEKNYEVESEFNFEDNFNNNINYLFERENLETKIYGKFLDDSTSNYFNFDKNYRMDSDSVSESQIKHKEKDFYLDFIKINNSNSTLHFMENKQIHNFKDSQIIEDLNNEINIIKSKLAY